MSLNISYFRKVAKIIIVVSILIFIISILLSIWNSLNMYIGIYAVIWGIIPASLLLIGIKVYEWKIKK